MNFNYSSIPIITIFNKFRKNQINLTPSFQRGYIWKSEFKDELIVSILSHYPIGNIIFNRVSRSERDNFLEEKVEVVDGQQRLQTIFGFVAPLDSYVIRSPKSIEKLRKIAEEYRKKFEFTFNSKDNDLLNKMLTAKTIRYQDLPSLMKDDFDSYNLNITLISEASSQAIAEYFKYVQNQETLKGGEIINSIYLYNEDLNEMVAEINDKRTLLYFINFNEKRYEFDKVFLSIVGVLSKKIKLNCANYLLVTFARNFRRDQRTPHVDQLINNLNLITQCFIHNEKQGVGINGNQRMLKILLTYLSFFKITCDDLHDISSSLEWLEQEKNGKDEFVSKVSFIEYRSRGYEDIMSSAYAFRYILENRLWLK